jgi:hypothetical protein
LVSLKISLCRAERTAGGTLERPRLVLQPLLHPHMGPPRRRRAPSGEPLFPGRQRLRRAAQKAEGDPATAEPAAARGAAARSASAAGSAPSAAAPSAAAAGPNHRPSAAWKPGIAGRRGEGLGARGRAGCAPRSAGGGAAQHRRIRARPPGRDHELLRGAADRAEVAARQADRPLRHRARRKRDRGQRRGHRGSAAPPTPCAAGDSASPPPAESCESPIRSSSGRTRTSRRPVAVAPTPT